MGSSSPVSTGYLLESHNLVSYRSLGVDRGLRLAYNSNGASPMPIIAANVMMPARTGPPRQVSSRIRIGGEERPGILYTYTDSLNGIVDQTIRQKIIYGAEDLDTGLYNYELLITGHFDGASITSIATGKTMVVNQRQSDFGAGWSLHSHHQLYIDSDGDVMLRFGNSDLKRFLKQADASFTSPMGDYSTLQLIGDEYIRTLKNGTKYIFNNQGPIKGNQGSQ